MAANPGDPGGDRARWQDVAFVLACGVVGGCSGALLAWLAAVLS